MTNLDGDVDMAVFLVPFVLPVLAAAGIIGGVVIDGEIKKGKAADEKAFKQVELRVAELRSRVEDHAARGEYGQAIHSFRELMSLYEANYSISPEIRAPLDKYLQDMLYTSQEEGQKLSYAFKQEWNDLKHGDPSRLFSAYSGYIENLKILLPEEDAFLQKQVTAFKRAYPDLTAS
ncbi:hypothetical protein [Pseudomonas sp.]|jgi:hypothetical protein|uniref:hypothetical protein n=1 Tax=Pseudomonas sp. TaxID=306 RepID=UPI00262A64F4|nr:hypothetical protein [Pseudomonas sp.]MDP9029074.1 hypothetical protein [Pseudomonadota bacterium]MDP9062039.1 hypothetical protein [Pseudomonadota bacterium]MDP9216872.1 hypothetical protein [Pseudomonadota bacterium]MDP9445773.1 hypothetical protein [Pseudomonadota bacterium]MDQ3593390.1 hypothetical protein [Pseudomonadota bacterium]